MTMDTRQERGRLVAQTRQIKHIEGPFYFVPSPTAGGYLLRRAEGPDGTGTCTCPSFAELRAHGEPGARCKHLWALEHAQGAVIKAPPSAEPPPVKAPLPRGDLSATEQEHVREALKHLMHAGVGPLAKGTRIKANTLKHVAYGRSPSAKLVLRLARFAGVPVDDLLNGKFPPRCPTCGQRIDQAAAPALAAEDTP